MFTVKTNKEIGMNLKALILQRYPSVRQFCICYLKMSKQDFEDPDQIRNLSNRFSQIINGKKAIQTYDLQYTTELLGVSAEDVLSCGEAGVPLKERITNYNVAFSKNELDWKNLLTMEEAIGAYADEYGKTVLDYALECKNYKFIKYLLDNNYITLVTQDPRYYERPNFGASTNIAERPYSHPTVEDSFYENKLLRTNILSLAVMNNDIEILIKFKAREIPSQFNFNVYLSNFDCNEYYDKNFIEEIALSKNNTLSYFLEEYKTPLFDDRYEIIWLYPFLDKIAHECIKNGEDSRALMILEVILEHNKKAFVALRKAFLAAAKERKNSYQPMSFQDAIGMVSRDYHVNDDKSFASFTPFRFKNVTIVAFNIFSIDFLSRNNDIQTKIDEINMAHSSIVNLPNNVIKNS